jgi:hypothetical protein
MYQYFKLCDLRCCQTFTDTHKNSVSSHSDLSQEASMTDIVNLNSRCRILSYKIQKFSNKKHGYTNRRYDEYKWLLKCDATRTGEVQDFGDGQ